MNEESRAKKAGKKDTKSKNEVRSVYTISHLLIRPPSMLGYDVGESGNMDKTRLDRIRDRWDML